MPKRLVKSESKQSNGLPAAPSSVVREGLFDCYDFISPSEYSENILGPFALLLEKSIGEINFADIMNEFLIRNQSYQPTDLLTLLANKRQHLPEIDASISKCLILNRWIKYIEGNENQFMSFIDTIQTNIRDQITDNQVSQIINYPNDFRQRERDFQQRADAQNIRRLFYYSLNESKAPSIIHLQNRTTEHLNCLIDSKMRYDRAFREMGMNELENIFRTSFMIVSQPHCGATPVLVYERERGHICRAKVSVTIVSVLHDFMQTHPDTIELNDIELTLSSSNNFYQLDGSQRISWKTCELRINPNDRPFMIKYAELNEILIKQPSNKKKQNQSPDELYTFTFLISVRLNLKEYGVSKLYQIPLQSLPFAIGTHHNHVPYLLTKVMMNDIQRFSQSQSVDVKILLAFVIRYFIHRTGVCPKGDFQTYLNKQLTTAKDENPNEQSYENIFLRVLFPFINQVEFMAKNPILIMFYEDGIFLGPCDSKQVEQVMKQAIGNQSPIIALRLNSIETLGAVSNDSRTVNKSMKSPPCFVRVDIYDVQTGILQNRTFNPKELIVDILNFVSTARESKSDHVRILSNASNLNDLQIYRFFTNYHHDRLNEIYKLYQKYKPLIDLLVHIEEKRAHHPANDRQNINPSFMSINNAHVDPPTSMTGYGHSNACNYNQNAPSMTTGGYMLLSDHSASSSQRLPHVLCNDKEVIEHVVAHPDLMLQILRRFRQMHTSNTRVPVQQQQPVTTMDVGQYPSTFVMTTQSNTTTTVQSTTNSTTDMSQPFFHLFDS